MAPQKILEHEIREVVLDYFGHHDSEIVEYALEYFNKEYSFRHIEKKLSKMVHHDDVYHLVSCLDLVYRKYQASEIKLLVDQNEKEQQQLRTILTELQDQNQLLTGQISLVNNQLVKANEENQSLQDEDCICYPK